MLVPILVLVLALPCRSALVTTTALADFNVAYLRHPAPVASVLESAGILTPDELYRLNAEELAELKLELRERGAVLSDRAKVRELWEGRTRPCHTDRQQLACRTQPFHAEKGSPKRQLQESEAPAQESSVNLDTMAIVLTGVVGIVGYVLQARQQSAQESAQAALAREAESAQATFDIEHQRREAKLIEVDEHLDVTRSLLLAFHHWGQSYLNFILEMNAIEDLDNSVQALGKQMMPNMIAGPLADVFDADTKDAWLTHGVNKFDSGAFAVNQLYFPVPAMHYLFGMMVSMPKGTMYNSAWEPDVEARYMADPAAPFAVRMREYTVQENIPLLREVVALIRKFGGSIEVPSDKFFKDTFPKRAAGSKEQHISHMVSYAQAWEPILLQWSDDNFSKLQPFVRSPGFVFQNILEENMRNAVTARQKLLDSESGAGAHQSTVSRLTAMAAMQDTGTDESGDDST